MKAIVTDDSKVTRLILTKFLEDLGFDVAQAEDGASLLGMLSEGLCDVCLVDWNMPGMNGTEVIRTLQAHPEWRQIPTVIVTDETRQERIDAALAAGAIGYLPKPFEVDALTTILEEAGLQLDFSSDKLS